MLSSGRVQLDDISVPCQWSVKKGVVLASLGSALLLTLVVVRLGIYPRFLRIHLASSLVSRTITYLPYYLSLGYVLHFNI